MHSFAQWEPSGRAVERGACGSRSAIASSIVTTSAFSSVWESGESPHYVSAQIAVCLRILAEAWKRKGLKKRASIFRRKPACISEKLRTVWGISSDRGHRDRHRDRRHHRNRHGHRGHHRDRRHRSHRGHRHRRNHHRHRHHRVLHADVLR